MERSTDSQLSYFQLVRVLEGVSNVAFIPERGVSAETRSVPELLVFWNSSNSINNKPLLLTYGRFWEPFCPMETFGGCDAFTLTGLLHLSEGSRVNVCKPGSAVQVSRCL